MLSLPFRFPHCTVLFAGKICFAVGFQHKDIPDSQQLALLDIVGFTAWSSMREPTQVFYLLEAIYHAFDAIAKRRKVFKVETVGASP